MTLVGEFPELTPSTTHQDPLIIRTTGNRSRTITVHDGSHNNKSIGVRSLN